MTKYFIHLVDGEDVICDPEGSDLPSMGMAREQAVLSAREILAEAVKAGKHHIPRFVVVVSEGGNEVAVIDIKAMLPSCLV